MNSADMRGRTVSQRGREPAGSGRCLLIFDFDLRSPSILALRSNHEGVRQEMNDRNA
jgi:hypothetical protein